MSDSQRPDQRFINFENKETFSAKENLINDSIPKKNLHFWIKSDIMQLTM